MEDRVSQRYGNTRLPNPTPEQGRYHRARRPSMKPHSLKRASAIRRVVSMGSRTSCRAVPRRQSSKPDAVLRLKASASLGLATASSSRQRPSGPRPAGAPPRRHRGQHDVPLCPARTRRPGVAPPGWSQSPTTGTPRRTRASIGPVGVDATDVVLMHASGRPGADGSPSTARHRHYRRGGVSPCSSHRARPGHCR